MLRSDRLERLYSRREPNIKTANFSANAESSTTTKAANAANVPDYRYISGAMRPIDSDSTEQAFREAERVKSTLASSLPARFLAEFDLQGSVTSDTHIRIHSDIDLLVLTRLFASSQSGTTIPLRQQDQVIAELTLLRDDAAKALRTGFPLSNLDTSSGKALGLSGYPLERKIDVVIGNWWDTDLYNQYKVKMARGINILDHRVRQQIKNLPFLHNFRINQKDEETGGLRKVIRLLKTLKYDSSPQLSISSYDIAAIAFNMSKEALTVKEGAFLSLATNAAGELKRFVDNSFLRESLNVPNGMRKVFCDAGASLEGMKSLHAALMEALGNIQRASMRGVIELNEGWDTLAQTIWREATPNSVRKHLSW